MKTNVWNCLIGCCMGTWINSGLVSVNGQSGWCLSALLVSPHEPWSRPDDSSCRPSTHSSPQGCQALESSDWRWVHASLPHTHTHTHRQRTLNRVSTTLCDRNSMTFAWLFHDQNENFYDYCMINTIKISWFSTKYDELQLGNFACSKAKGTQVFLLGKFSVNGYDKFPYMKCKILI